MDQDNQDEYSGLWQEQYQQPKKTQQSNMALASLIMGIIGIVTSCCFGGIIFGSLGILFALLSKTEDKFEGYANAGLITSAISLVLTVILGVAFVYMVFSGMVMGGEF